MKDVSSKGGVISLALPLTTVGVALGYLVGRVYWSAYFGAFNLELGMIGLPFERIVTPEHPVWVFAYQAGLLCIGLLATLPGSTDDPRRALDGTTAARPLQRLGIVLAVIFDGVVIYAFFVIWDETEVALRLSAVVTGVVLFFALRIPRSGLSFMLLAAAVATQCYWADHYGRRHALNYEESVRPLRYRVEGEPATTSRTGWLLHVSPQYVFVVQAGPLETRVIPRERVLFLDLPWSAPQR